MVVGKEMTMVKTIRLENFDKNFDKEFNINDYINDLPPANEISDEEESMQSIKNEFFKNLDDFNGIFTDGLTDGLTESEFTEALTENLEFGPDPQTIDGVEFENENNGNSNVGGSIQPNSIEGQQSGVNNSSIESKTKSSKIKKPKKRKKRSRLSKVTTLSPSVFKKERNKLMMIIIKYISIKITNLFPPTSKESKISLEKFLIIMINRLKLSLNSFLKSIIYLIRYMDIIYLLRYLNQSNNFANFNEMDFSLKKLIIGCIKLTLMQEKIYKNWSNLVGLSNNDINLIIKKILTRLNNKLIIKDDEFEKFKLEIFRYVKMISSEY